MSTATLHPIVAPTQRGHGDADYLLREWVRRTLPARCAPGVKQEHLDDIGYLAEYKEGFALSYPGDFGWVIRVWFYGVKGYPDLMRIRSTNYRCEHEPNGYMTIADARELYARLLRTGMTPT